MKNSDFSFLLTRYLTHYLPVQRNLSSNTIRSYRDNGIILLFNETRGIIPYKISF